MLNTYRTVAGFGQDEIIIEKSTFIGYAKPVTSEEEAQAFIQEIKNSKLQVVELNNLRKNTELKTNSKYLKNSTKRNVLTSGLTSTYPFISSAIFIALSTLRFKRYTLFAP